MTTEPELTVREHMMLGVERNWWKYSGMKEAHVLEHLGMSMTRYHQVLLQLIETERAEAADARLVRRLRRIRDERARQRSAVRLGIAI